MKSFIYFRDNYIPPQTQDTLVVRIPQCNSMDALYDQLAKSLRFIKGFGNNLDALWECITSMSEISQKYILIIHEGALNIPDSKFEDYIVLMAEAINLWDLESMHTAPFVNDFQPEHYLDIAFSETMKARISAILDKNQPDIALNLEIEQADRQNMQ